MKRSLLIILILIVSVLFSAVSCTKKQQVDRKELVAQMVEEGKYREAKQLLITLRGQYPNDPKLIELARRTDENIARELYELYWEEAEEKGGYKDWIAAMIKMKKVENTNRDMVNEWIEKATQKCIDAGEKQLDDAKLLGLLNQLVQRYQVISHNDRLMLITMFVKDGRFPLKEWKDTFLTRYQELMDMDTEEFVGFPRPAESEKKK